MNTIPLIIQNSQIFAPVSIAGKKTFAYLNSSSTTNHAFSSVQDQFQLNSSIIKDYVVGQAETQLGYLSSVEFLGQKYNNLEVEYLSNWDKNVQEEHNFPIGMSLSASVLFSQPIVLDFSTQQLAILDKELPNWVEVPCIFVKNVPILDLNLGKRQVKAIFHTGGGISSFNSTSELVTDLQILAKTTAHYIQTGIQREMDVFKGPEIKVADVSLGHFEGLVQDLTNLEERFETKIDMKLGMNTLISSGQVWFIDKQKQKVMVAPPSERFNWSQ